MTTRAIYHYVLSDNFLTQTITVINRLIFGLAHFLPPAWASIQCLVCEFLLAVLRSILIYEESLGAFLAGIIVPREGRSLAISLT